VAEQRQITDDQLIERTLAGEGDAFGILVRRWERQIFGLALRVLGHEETARDVCQETFLSAFRNLSKFRGDAQFSSWLYRITLNQCNTHLRRTEAKANVSLDEQLESGAPEPASSAECADDAINREQMTKHLRRALAAIPVEMRQVIIMKEYEGLKFHEIAEILDLPVSTIKTRLYTGLTQLRRRLEHVRGSA